MKLHAPEELTSGRLHRLGEGIGKVVYASRHWVVKRERHSSEILALIVVWKAIRRLERLLPRHLGRRLVDRPAHQIHFLSAIAQVFVGLLPRSLWLLTHAGEVWRTYRQRDRQGERLHDEHLAGTSLVPERISFPPTKVMVDGWPGWLTVSEATERVEMTLYQRLRELAAAQRYEEMGVWLDRWLAMRRAGWERGVFSLDVHPKNFGVTGDRVVLLDAGGLTRDWKAIEQRLSYENKVSRPHQQLGLGPLLKGHPELAMHFDVKWKATVNPRTVQHHWPDSLD
jgi:hypothetical protein